MSSKSPAPSEAAPLPSKADVVCTLLREPSGATLEQITSATGWKPHSARAFLSGLKKKGASLDRTKLDGLSRYRIVAESGE
ncbi:DUF3489 domain-containing protein [Altererythrobacter sp. SALINAS58]|nr:DUF3489 domain-containing protein [Alteripontixanthobacter muriae]